MAAVDIIITLTIIIKIIDIFVVSYKKKNKEKAIKADTKKPDRIPIIIMTIIIIMLIGVGAKNQKIEVSPKQEQQVSKVEQPIANSYPAGIYMQPLLSVTTGIMNQMGNGMVENTKRAQQKAKENLLKATRKAQEKERLRHK